MIGTRVVIRAATLALAAAIAVPAAQAAVPPIKRFPKIFINNIKAGPTAQSAIVVGEITLHNGQLGDLSCRNMIPGRTYNELTEGTEKGFLNPTGYATYACKSQSECNIENTKGEVVPGIYATAEAPPVAVGTEAHETGISSLPWTGELIERETGKRQVLIKHVKLWVVIPPSPPGKGTGCAGVEIPFEDQEGPSEKEAGDELAPIWVNGTRNGLKPAGLEFPGTGETGLTEKGFPVTGRLISPIGVGYVGSNRLLVAGLGGAWELITVE